MALARAGLGKDDVELYEINEAFAVVTAACTRLAGIPSDRVNVRGSDQALLVRKEMRCGKHRNSEKSSSGCETRPTKAEPGRSVASLAALSITAALMRRHVSM
jgi:hypothetical protein